MPVLQNNGSRGDGACNNIARSDDARRDGIRNGDACGDAVHNNSWFDNCVHKDCVCNDSTCSCGEFNDGAYSADSILYYEAHAKEYAAATLNADMSVLYEQFEQQLAPGCRILDLGCGSGRDSRYFAGRGYEVAAADPSARMCEIAKAIANACNIVNTYTSSDAKACTNTYVRGNACTCSNNNVSTDIVTYTNVGTPVYTIRAEEVAFNNEFDAVWACASLLHVSRADQALVMQRIAHALKPGGVLYASWKYGTQDRVVDGRTFTDMDEAGLQASLEQVSELRLIKSWISSDVRPDQHEQRWLNVLVGKIHC